MRTLAPILLALFALAACGPGSDAPEAPPDEPAAAGDEERAPEPSDTSNVGEEAPSEPNRGRVGPDGMCGGIAGFQCPEGQWCVMEADHPDASGTCRPEGECDEPADCEPQDLVHTMCVGGWACADGECAWECS